MVTNHTYSDAGLIGGPATSVDPRIFRDDNRTRLDLIKSFGKDLLSVNSEYSSSYAGTGEADGVDGFAIINDESSEVAVLLYNFTNNSGGRPLLIRSHSPSTVFHCHKAKLSRIITGLIPPIVMCIPSGSNRTNRRNRRNRSGRRCVPHRNLKRSDRWLK
jgi:hypothetical protein